MTYCPNCGSAVEAGRICSCQQPQYDQPQYQQPQYQQPQYPQPYGTPPSFASAKRPGKTMIMVAGIIMTVFGGVSVLINASAYAAASILFGGLSALLLFELAVSALMLAFGICGIVMAPKRERASAIMGFGVTIIALRLIDLIWAISILGDLVEYSTIVGVFAGCALPILYIVGGNLRKKASF